jgi:hypothetical protein
VIPAPFDYVRPGTVEEAVAAILAKLEQLGVIE